VRVLTPQSLSKIFLRNIAIIIPLSLIGIFVGNYFSSITTPLYRSSADLFISTPASAVDIGLLATGSTFSQERVKSYTQIISAPSTLKPVIEKLELNTTPEALAAKISASAPSETVVIRLTVVDQNPERAAAIANEVGRQFALTAESLELPQMDLTSPVKVSVVRPAVPEYGPVSPKINTNRLLGATSFLLLGYLFFVIRYSLDSTIKNVNDLGELNLLAAIGFDPNADKKPLINEIGPYDARNEAYRALRTNISNVTGEDFPVSIAIISGVAEEGKTSASINIAITFANQGIKTLLLEGDLRRPRFKQYLNLNNDSIKVVEAGVTQLLGHESFLHLKKDFPKVINFAFENVDFIHSGEIAENPTELLGSLRLSELIAEAKKNYQLVIVDCPPVLPIADASVICKAVDGSIIVVHGGKTKSKSYLATIAAIKNVTPKIFGVVINKIPNNRESADYGYLSGYSKYYKSGYGYILKRRGYTPYSPYSPKEIIDFERKKNKSLKNGSDERSRVDFSKFSVAKLKEKFTLKKSLKKAFIHDSERYEADEITKWLDEISKKSNLKKSSEPQTRKKGKK
jgi:non-specific protein-tyrosine kinase